MQKIKIWTYNISTGLVVGPMHTTLLVLPTRLNKPRYKFGETAIPLATFQN